jgi:hypothetical protein
VAVTLNAAAALTTMEQHQISEHTCADATCKVDGTGSFYKVLEGSGCFQKVPDASRSSRSLRKDVDVSGSSMF